MKRALIIFLSCILFNSCSVVFDPGYRTVYHSGHDVVYYRYDNRYRPIHPPYHYHYHYTPKPYHPTPPPKHHRHRHNSHHTPYHRK